MKKRLAVILTIFLALEAASPAFAAGTKKNNVENIAAREEQAAIDYVTGPAAGGSEAAGEQQTAAEEQAAEMGKPSEVTGKNAPDEAVSQTEAPAGEEEQEASAAAETASETASETEASAGPGQEAETSEEGQETETAAVERGEKGIYLGTFTTTGYSNPDGSASADGTMPRAQHTVSTDWNVLPPGSRIRFGDSDIIYTVEDTGVHGNWVDVYYPSHSEAWSHGLVYKEVYLVE